MARHQPGRLPAAGAGGAAGPRRVDKADGADQAGGTDEADGAARTGGAAPPSGWSILLAGRLREARVVFRGEASAAEQVGDAEALAEAALGLGGIWVHEHRDTIGRAGVIALQRRALAGLTPSSPTAQRLRIRLAAESTYLHGDPSPVLTELVEARASGNPLVVAEAVSLAHHCILGPGYRQQRLELAEELLAVAPLTGRPFDALMGLLWRTVDLFLAGDHRAGRSLRELRDGLDRHPCDAIGFAASAMEVMVTMRAGRLAEAEALATTCLQLGTEVGDADAAGWFGAQLLAIRWLEGRSDEVLPLVSGLDGDPTVAEHNQAFTAAAASLAAAAGDLATARSALARLTADGLGDLPPSSVWLATLLGAAEAAYALGDTDAAAEVYRLMAPFASLPVMGSLAVVCYGSAHRPLGLAALTLGHVDLAVEHLEAACAADLALGNGPRHAIDLATLADALTERAGPDDRDRAAELRARAVEEAGDHGMERRAAQWGRGRRRRSDHPSVRMERQGRMWSVTCGDRVAIVRNSIGMTYLSQLVAQPDRSVPAIELASTRVAAPAGRGQELIDRPAREQYRRRVADLQAEIDDADACADLERAATARLELDALIEQLSRATGLDGRSRTFTSEPERARTSVRKALSRALAAIADVDAGLAAEIEARLETGVRCVFHTAVAH